MNFQNVNWEFLEGSRKLDTPGSYMALRNIDNYSEELLITVEEDDDYYDFAKGSKTEYIVHYNNDAKDIFQVIFSSYDKDLVEEFVLDIMENGIEKFEDELDFSL